MYEAKNYRKRSNCIIGSDSTYGNSLLFPDSIWLFFKTLPVVNKPNWAK